MNNKTYKELYNELKKENDNLKLNLEAKTSIIDRIHEDIAFLNRHIDEVYSNVTELHNVKDNVNKDIKEYSTAMFNDVESKLK